MQQTQRTPMSKCEFNKLHFGMGIVLMYKTLLHAYFQNTFSEEHLWMVASDTGYLGPGRFPGIAGNAGNHGNDGKIHKSHKIPNQI